MPARARLGWLPPLGVYLGLLALHGPLLRLPYYWDEAGYFIFAGLDLWRHGWLVPRSTLANGHPPGLSLYLAGAWTLAGFHPLVTRAAMLGFAAALVWGVYRLAEPRLGRAGAAVAAALVGLDPLVFAQATLAQLDLPVAALVIWALVWRARRRPWVSAGLLCGACLIKETAVIAAGALLAAELWRAWRRGRSPAADGGRRRAAALAPPLMPMMVVGMWFVYYHHVTGYWFGNPQFFAYNVSQAALSVPRIALSLVRRVWQLAGYDSMWGLTLLAGWSLWRRRQMAVGERQRGVAPPPDWLAVIAVYVVFHAVIGGAVLARYLLPALALLIIWETEQILRLPQARWWVLGGAAVLVAGWFWNPPYPFPYEDNLAYVRFIELHQAAARELERQFAAGRGRGPVWTAWPATGELSRPDLGYVSRPLPVRRIQNFSLAAMNRLRQRPEELYLYSREYQPRWDLAAAAPFWQRWEDRYFHHDPPAPPQAWLRRWKLAAGYERRGGGQWVTIAWAASSRRRHPGATGRTPAP